MTTAKARSTAKTRTVPSATTESRARLLVMVAAGIVAGAASGLAFGWEYAATVGWALACIVYISWVWLAVLRLDGAGTKTHADREDPTSGISEVLTLIASIGSIGAVVILIIAAKNAHGIEAVLVPIVAVISLALSWFLVHTLFTLRYARLYFDGTNSDGTGGGIDFNQKEAPRYTDFAYLAFTLGMTYQVSDTDLQTHAIRALALRHALISYLFGAVILAATINLVAGLAS